MKFSNYNVIREMPTFERNFACPYRFEAPQGAKTSSTYFSAIQ